MKSSLKKIFAFTLVCVLAVSCMTACGNGNNSKSSESKQEASQSQQSSGQSQGGASSEAENTEFSYPMDSDAHLQYWITLNGNVSAVSPTMNDAPFGKAWVEQTGVDVEFVHPPQGQEGEQLGIILGSGEYPDIIEYTWNSVPGGLESVLGEVIIDLTEPINQYAPNLKKFLEENPDIDKLVKTEDGRYYCFPYIMTEPKLLTFQCIMLRKDWLDDLNLEVPETVDEYHDMLLKFKEEKGASAPLTPVSMQHNALVGAWGVIRGCFVEDGKIVYGQYDPRYKDYLMTMNQWYEEGLLGGDLATAMGDGALADSNILNGNTGMIITAIGSKMGTYINALREKDPNADIVAAPSIVLNKGDEPQFGQSNNPFTGEGAAITVNCKDVEAACRFLDYNYSEAGNMLCNFGVEGESYNMVDGYPTYTDLILHNPDGLSVGVAMSQYTMIYSGPYVKRVEYIEQYYGMPQQAHALDVATANNMPAHRLPPLTFTPEETSELAEINTNLDTLISPMVLKYITGLADFDKYDEEFIKPMENFNVKRMIEIYQNAYDRYMAR